MDIMEIIRVENVRKVFTHGVFRRSSVEALRGVSLALHEGERIAIIGESGSGKTTLARIMTGLEKPTSGTVYWFGKPIDKLPKREFKEMKLKIQYVYQDPYSSLNPAMKVRDILGDPLRRQGIRNVEEKIIELLRLVKVTPPEYFLDKYPYHLSGGMRQRIALARVLTADPKAIVADEPVSMIDMIIRRSLVDTLIELSIKLGLAIALISHDIALAYYFALDGFMYVMYQGLIVEYGSAKQLLSNPLHPYTRLLIVASPQHKRDYREQRFEEMNKYLKSSETSSTPKEREKGCPYAPKCPFASEKCFNNTPELIEFERGHFVRCINIDKLPSFKVPWIELE